MKLRKNDFKVKLLFLMITLILLISFLNGINHTFSPNYFSKNYGRTPDIHSSGTLIQFGSITFDSISIFFLSWLIFSKKVEIKLNNLKFLFSFVIIIIFFPICYLSWTYLNFNHFFPISGILWGIDIFNIITYVFFIFIISLLLSLYYRSRPLINILQLKVESKFILILVISSLHFPYYLYIRGRLANWYFPLELIVLSIFIPFLLLIIIELCHSRKIKRKKIIKSSIFIMSSIIVFILNTSLCVIFNYLVDKDLFFPYQEDLDIYIVSNWLNTNTPQGANIVSGNKGKLWYFTNRILIEIWGFVNSFEFFKKI